MFHWEAIQFFVAVAAVLTITVTFVWSQAERGDDALEASVVPPDQEPVEVRSQEQRVGSLGLSVMSVLGEREATGPGDPLTTLVIRIQTDAGRGVLDLGQVTVDVSDGAVYRLLDHDPQEAGAGTFSARALRDSGDTFQPSHPLLTGGDVAEIRVDLEANGLALHPLQALFVILIHTGDEQVLVETHTPGEFGGDRAVRLT